jgi:hypothetical protein
MKNNLFQKLLFPVLFLSATTIISAQQDLQEATRDTLYIPSPVQRYFAPHIGLKQQIFRDFATSPLFYQGPGIELGLSWNRSKKTWENIFGFDLTSALTIAQTPDTKFFKIANPSFFLNGSIYNQTLWNLKRLSDYKNTYQLGGIIETLLNTRINSTLMNNTLGIENVTNFMASAKYTRDISRLNSKTRKRFLLKDKVLKPVKRSIAAQANVGVLNFNYRPGYAYNYFYSIGDDESSQFIFSDYKLKMNGWRFDAKLEFTKYKNSGNGYKWAYIWNAISVPGSHERFEIGSHSIRYTLLINR